MGRLLPRGPDLPGYGAMLCHFYDVCGTPMSFSMLDAVTASTTLPQAAFTHNAFVSMPGWYTKRVTKADTGEVYEEYRHLSTEPSSSMPRRFIIAVSPSRRTLTVQTNLVRLLVGCNWEVLAASDVAPACEVVDRYLRRCLGSVADGLRPFGDWPVTKAEYPHDVRVGSSDALERWLRALDGHPLRQVRRNGGVPLPYQDSRQKRCGLAWRGKNFQAVLYDKRKECSDPDCPSDLLRIETRIMKRVYWERFQSSGVYEKGTTMTVARAASLDVASAVMLATYDSLGFEQLSQDGVADPVEALLRHHPLAQARTLAGFHAFTMIRGECASRSLFGDTMFVRHRRALQNAGVAISWGDTHSNADTLSNLPPIPRPTIDYLSRRKPLVGVNS